MKKFPIDAILVNGKHIVLHTIMEAKAPLGNNIFGEGHEGIFYDIPNNVVTVRSIRFHHEGPITFHGGITNGDIIGIFADNTYKDLPVKNKTLVDVGGSIADSAIYFALCGANKIICVEPVPKNYELAQRNIEFNSFSDKIILVLAGCSDKRGEIIIDPSYSNGAFSILKGFKDGVKVPLLTLRDILNDYNLLFDDSTILKMDCEGCEYDSILSADKTTLLKFST